MLKNPLTQWLNGLRRSWEYKSGETMTDEAREKLKGIRQNMERRVRYIANTRGVAEQDVWEYIYKVALRKLTLIIG